MDYAPTRVQQNLRQLEKFEVLYTNIVMHYYFNAGKPVPIVANKHGNAKDGASDFSTNGTFFETNAQTNCSSGQVSCTSYLPRYADW